MEEIGQPERRRVAGAALAFAGSALAVALLTCSAAWPFAIDDAWISVRYARHLASGAGYVWNLGGASTDGVTPLPWAFLLAPLAAGAPVVVLARAKLAGAVVWSLAAAAWGRQVGRARSPAWAKASALALLAVDLPVAAHAVSGMETAFATALATLAAVSYRAPRRAAVLAGLAAALRPELVVWSVAVAAGLAWCAAPRSKDASSARVPARAIALGLVASVPFVLCALARAIAFGHLAPLSLAAKPSDLAHGLAYAGAAAVFSLAPILLLAPVALARERGPAMVLTVAAALHVAVVAAVGGDWMPYARLVAPIVPSMLLAFVWVSAVGSARAHAARVLVAVAVAASLVPKNVGALRRAGEGRAAMIEAARALVLTDSKIAAVDIGWVSAVTEGTITDLAGVTDPEVAALGGGHTSKRIDASFLVAKAPDIAAFYADPLPATLADVSVEAFPRVVEARLARASVFTEHFAPSALLPLGGSTGGYVLYRRLPY